MRRSLVILAFVAPVAFGQTQFERFLVPIYLEGETGGGFGSRWVSELRIMNAGPGAVQIENYGIGCRTDTCFPETLPVNLSAPGDRLRAGIGGVPAAFVIVKPEYARQLVFQARVRDVSRENQSWGTSLPVVHESEAVRDRLHLLGVPVDARYRQTLRIYSFDLALGRRVRVRVYAERDFAAALPGVERDDDPLLGEFVVDLAYTAQKRPLYAEVGDIGSRVNLAGQNRIRIEVLPEGAFGVWALVSVTNNITQEVTIIAPSRIAG